MWRWVHERAIRQRDPESFSGHDSEVFGYTVDVKTSRDVSPPSNAVRERPDDDIAVMA